MLPILVALVLAQAPASAPPVAAIERLPFDASSVGRGYVLKDVVQGVRWRDANGENLVVLSHVTRTRDYENGDQAGSNQRVSVHELLAVHVVRAGGKERELRRVRDSSVGCGFDNNTKFLDGSLEVSDLDQDGVGEVLFAYFVQCTSDMSPATLKLLLLENGDKYILRGENSMREGENGEYRDGKLSVDPSFDKGPRVFRKHALSRWAQWKRRQPWGS